MASIEHTKQQSQTTRGLMGMASWARPRLPHIAALVAIAIAATAQASGKTVIEGIEVDAGGADRTVRIRTSSEPTFTVFRLQNPMRVVVDVSGGDLSQLKSPITVGDGVVDQIAMRQFSADGFMIARIIVGFDNEVAYEVKAQGRAVVITTGDAPSVPVDRALPPPAAPVDHGAAERLVESRKQAELAAQRAVEERQRAEEAATYAAAQQREAEMKAAEAKRLHAEAERAQTEAATLREQAEKAIARDRSEAQRSLQLAEERLRRIESEQHQVASARAEADRIAAKAEQSRRNAEETAAAAEAKHKQRVAGVEEQIAQAQKEKEAADAAWKRARQAKEEAEKAETIASQATQAALETRKVTTTKLARIEERERELEAKYRAIGAREQELETERQLTVAQQRELEKQKSAAQQKEKRLADRLREVAAQQQRVESERQRISILQAKVDEAQAAIAHERANLEKARESFAKKKSHGEARDANQVARELAAEREKLNATQTGVEAAQRELEAERSKLANARRKLEKAQEGQRQLEQERKSLERERREIDEQRNELAKKEAALERQKLAAKERQTQERADQQRQRDEQESRAAAREKQAAEERASLAAERRQLEAERQKVTRVDKRSRRAASTASFIEPNASRVTLASTTLPAQMGVSRSDRNLVLEGVERNGSGNEAGVLLRVSGGTPSYEAQRIENPPRLVLDLADTVHGSKRTSLSIKTPFIWRVRLGDHGSVARVVFDLTTDTSKHVITATAEGLLVTMEAPPTMPVATNSELEADSAEKSQPTAAPVAPSGEVKAVHLKDLRFKGAGELAEIMLDVGSEVSPRVDNRSKKAWVLELHGATVPKQLERSLDTTAYGTVVRLVSTYQATENPPVVKIVANLSGKATFDLERRNGLLVWRIRGKAGTMVASVVAPQTAGFTAEATVLATSTPKQTRKESKRRITIDLKDADIVNVLRLLAEVSGENIVASDDVKGKITLHLSEVPWDEALETILKTKGYDKVRHHNILRIALSETIQKEREQALATQKANEQVEPTLIKMVPINYADAKEIESQVKSLLTGRGTVQVDSRTNTLIIEDIKSNIDRVVLLTRHLDKQTPQVLIEARIVEATTNNSEALGIQWGGNLQASAATGNATGLSFPNSIQNDFAVNVPAGIASGGALGFVFGSAGGSSLLNLRLQALEEEGKGKIISSPRITTLDNRTAKISQGIDIPITVTSQMGVASTRFVAAALELEVTPHVTNDGSVLMKIKTSKNEPNLGLVGFDNTPSIAKKNAETEVLVRDGDTTVIGGIYTRSTSEVYSKVPILGDLPIIGWLFKSRNREDKRAELLIFITPRIVNRQESVVQSGSLPGGVVP